MRLFPKTSLGLSLLLSLFLASCFKEDASTQSEPAVENTATLEQPWDWNAYPESDHLILGTMPATIHPKRSLQIKSEANGTLSLRVTEPTTLVKKDTLWAEMNMEGLSAKKERLTIRERSQNIEFRRNEELELPAQKAQAEEDHLAARKKVRLMETVLKSQVMDEMASLLGLSADEITQESLEKSREALDLAERKLAFAEQFESKLQSDQKRLREMELRDSQRDYHETRERSQYLAPFDGELRLDLDHIVGQQDYSVISREVLATLSDYTEIHARLLVRNANWISLSPDTLKLTLKNSQRTVFTFLDDRYIKTSRGAEERNYIFSIPLEENSDLKRLTGSSIDAELSHLLPQPCRIVPKLDLSLHARNKTNAREWKQLVHDLFPDAELIAEGLEHLAIALSPQT